MHKSTVHTVGHGNKSFEQLLNELLCFNIEYLLDVRSTPYSKFNPQFNKEVLSHALAQNNVTYVFMGQSLGGMPNNPQCYTNGKVDYAKLKVQNSFQQSLQRLVVAHSKGIKVALMCSESMPETCHRAKLIGHELYQRHNITTQHIIKPNQVLDQVAIMNKLTKGKNIKDLFGNEILLTTN